MVPWLKARWSLRQGKNKINNSLPDCVGLLPFFNVLKLIPIVWPTFSSWVMDEMDIDVCVNKRDYELYESTNTDIQSGMCEWKRNHFLKKTDEVSFQMTQRKTNKWKELSSRPSFSFPFHSPWQRFLCIWFLLCHRLALCCGCGMRIKKKPFLLSEE